MWRSKKFIIVAVLAAVLLVGGIGGVALAQENEDEIQPKTLITRVAEILGIDQQEVEDAFTQARSQMQEEALGNYLGNLVAEGKITQEEADEYKAWYQSRPDMETYRQQLIEWQQARPGVPPEFGEWQEAMPDVPLPGRFGQFGGQCFPDGMGGGRHFWGR